MSSSLPEFVIARFLQGIGGSMMTPVGRLVLVRAVPKNEFVSAMTWLTIPGLIGPMAGPPLGGFITTYLHLALDLPDQRANRSPGYLAFVHLPA